MSDEDKYEQYLTGHCIARPLVESAGMEPDQDVLKLMGSQQTAHDDLVNEEAARMLLQLVNGVRSGKVSPGQVGQTFGLDVAALLEFLNRLNLAT